MKGRLANHRQHQQYAGVIISMNIMTSHPLLLTASIHTAKYVHPWRNRGKAKSNSNINTSLQHACIKFHLLLWLLLTASIQQ